MPTPTIVWMSGWEHGRRPSGSDSNPLDGLGPEAITGEDVSNLTVDATAARTGNYGLHLNINGTGRSVRYQFPAGSSIMVSSFYFKFITLPTAVVNVSAPAMTSGTAIPLRYDNTSGCMQLDPPAGGTGTVTGNIVVKANTWYRVDILYNFKLNHQVDWYMAEGDGAGILQPQCTDTQAADSSRWIAYGTGAAVTEELCIDDALISQTASDWPIGPHAIYKHPISQVYAAEHQGITTTQWQYTDDFVGAVFTNFSGDNETDSRSRMDDMDTTTGIRMNAAVAIVGNGRWKFDVNPLAPSAGGSLIAAQLITSVRESVSGADNAVLRLLLNGATTNHFSGDPTWDTTWNWLRTVFNAPPGETGWRPDMIDQLRFEMDSSDPNPNIWLASVYLEAAYLLDPVLSRTFYKNPGARTPGFPRFLPGGMGGNRLEFQVDGDSSNPSAPGVAIRTKTLTGVGL